MEIQLKPGGRTSASNRFEIHADGREKLQLGQVGTAAASWGYAFIWRVCTQLLASPFQRQNRPVSLTVQTNDRITFPKPSSVLHVPLISPLHTFSSKNHLHGDITDLPLQLPVPPVLQRDHSLTIHLTNFAHCVHHFKHFHTGHHCQKHVSSCV